jgi:hypothetical protein
MSRTVIIFPPFTPYLLVECEHKILNRLKKRDKDLFYTLWHQHLIYFILFLDVVSR